MAPITVHTLTIDNERVLGYGFLNKDGDFRVTIHLTNNKRVELTGAEAEAFVSDFGWWGHIAINYRPRQ
jgi:hypothetical protein